MSSSQQVPLAIRAIGRLLQAVGIGIVFVTATAAGVVIHSNTKAMRMLVAWGAGEALRGVVAGTISLSNVGELTIGREAHLRAAEIKVLDPNGKRVIAARGVDVRVDLARFLASLARLTRSAPIDVSLKTIGIDDAEIVLEKDEDGTLGLSRAFASRAAPAAMEKASEHDTLYLSLGSVRIGHAWAHGNVPFESFDANVENLRLHASMAKSVLGIDIDQAHATMQLPQTNGVRSGAALQGALAASARIDLAQGTQDTTTAHGRFEGNVDGIPIAAHASLDGDQVEGSVDVTKTDPGVIAHALPAAARLTEPIAFSVKVRGTLPSVAVDARATVGAATATVKGEALLSANTTFRADIDLANVDAHAFGAAKTDLSGAIHVEGSIDNAAPTGNFTLATKASTVGGVALPKLVANGSFDTKKASAKIHATEPGLDAVGNVSTVFSAQAIAFDVTTRAADLRATGRMPGIAEGSASVRTTGKIDLAKATMAGHATLVGQAVRVGPTLLDEIRANASITGPIASPAIGIAATVDGLHFTRQSSEPLDWPKARGSLDIDVRMGRASLDGHASLALTAKGGFGGEIHAAFEKRHVRASARVTAGPTGWLEVQHAEIDLPRRLSASSIARATGAADVRGALDLAQGLALCGTFNLAQNAPIDGCKAVEHASGVVELTGRVERGDEKALPVVRITARTQGLDLVLQGAEKPWTIHGIDGSVHVAYDGVTDDTEISALAWDAHGALANAGAKAKLPLWAMATGKTTLTRRDVGRIAASAIVNLPERNIHDIPSWIARLANADVRGTYSARADLAGTIRRPEVIAGIRFSNVGTVGAQHAAPLPAPQPPTPQNGQRERRARQIESGPVDGAIDAHWDGEHVVVTARADERDERESVEVEVPARASNRASGTRGVKPTRQRERGQARGFVIARLHARDVIRGITDDREPAWNASAELDVRNLELGLLPIPFAVRGALTGRASLRHLNENASLEANGTIGNLNVGNVRLKSGNVALRAQDGMLFSAARVDQDDGGSAAVQMLSHALRWKGMQVAWDGSSNTSLEYDVEAMKLAFLRPLVRKFTPEIDGRVDGKGRVSIDGKSQVFEGGLAIQDGRVYVNAMGEELKDIHAKAEFDKNGIFRVKNMSGKIGAGEFHVSLSGRMNGLQLQSAEATIVVPTKGGIPLSSDGATYAGASGEVHLSATMSSDGKNLALTTTVPRAEITLPERATQSLQSLEPDATIDIGVRGPTGALVAVPKGPTRRSSSGPADAGEASPRMTTRVSIVLGNDVLLQGRGIRIYLQGKTLLDLASELAMTGSFNLKTNGTIDVQGRRFIVDHGTITFTPGAAPDNPQVVAAAYWDAPDRTRVWVEFAGPIKTGKLKLRSEPAYSRNEILSLLLFGRPDPDAATGGERQSSAEQATAMGASVASAGLNQALGELDEDVDFEQDATAANRSRTKVGYRLRRNLKVQFGYAAGYSAREQDTTYLFVDWQFLPKWSAVVTRGDKGTSILDVLFRHRY
ncbi:MAG: translocation/assembly module TamB [Polyangiaceae bacterium]|nr:translocation/assembly module TamB [Polyangiaceae bacterium]